jgi:hypothetical protein
MLLVALQGSHVAVRAAAGDALGLLYYLCGLRIMPSHQFGSSIADDSIAANSALAAGAQCDDPATQRTLSPQHAPAVDAASAMSTGAPADTIDCAASTATETSAASAAAPLATVDASSCAVGPESRAVLEEAVHDVLERFQSLAKNRCVLLRTSCPCW